ncbi:hypothetical protein MKW94_016688 [Papaver nudicaule]|uniref:Leucine-rich repeat-containing N-terminal plant-type domain-containing protein n=1 Tax=Papaver nudicaule TaxID=74823 RepID=A0AA41SFS8_PAPNU|nr:hypothetical protein [Papaver nudicaule]
MIFFHRSTLNLTTSISNRVEGSIVFEMSVLDSWKLFAFLVICIHVQVLNSQNLSCNSDDLRALNDFTKGLESRINGWGQNSDCCTWVGVLCESSIKLGLNGSNNVWDKRVVGLELRNRSLSGNLSDALAGLDQLRYLNLAQSLYRYVANDLWMLKQLKTLYIQNNSLSGPLIGVANLSNLVRLDLSQNMFSETLPDAFASLGKLEYMDAHSNLLSGPLPTSLLNSPTIQFLNLRNNSFSGSLNLNWTNMSNLRSLDLRTNRLHGPIPDTLSSCRKLRFLNLARNYLNSPVPDSFKNLHALSFLSLSNSSLHNISATLEALQHCKNLTTLILSINFHGEEIPNANFHFKSLQALVIPHCRLTGSIPHWLRSTTKLQLLDLSLNSLVGTIPDWFNELKFLFYVDLSNNSLSGEIPKGLTKLPSLISFNKTLENPVNGPFFSKQDQSTRGMQYNRILSFPATLDLSYNLLSGHVLPEFGNLKNLGKLDLQSNHLEGPIPRELSGMTRLETLDLSHNSLSGIIPPSLINLTFLSRFSVAYNDLAGRVPTGAQFSTFPCSSFEGNHGLQDLVCSVHPGSNTEPRGSPTSGNEEEESNVTIFGPTFGVGVTAGFVVTVLICFISGKFMPPVKQGRHRTRNRSSRRVIHNQ